MPSHCVCLWRQYRHGALDYAVSLYVPMRAIQTRSTGLCCLIVCACDGNTDMEHFSDDTITTTVVSSS